MGVPVVGLAEMGALDILEPRQGCLVPADDPDDFARAWLEMLTDAPMRHRLGVEARDYAQEWSDDRLARRLSNLYRDVAGQASPCQEILRAQSQRLARPD